MKKIMLFLIAIALSLSSISCAIFNDDETDSGPQLIYKVLTMSYGDAYQGQYIAYGFDDLTYYIATKDGFVIARGTYTAKQGEYCYVIQIQENEFWDSTTGKIVTGNNTFSTPMKNNNTEFMYYSGDGRYFRFILEAFYKLRYN